MGRESDHSKVCEENVSGLSGRMPSIANRDEGEELWDECRKKGVERGGGKVRTGLACQPLVVTLPSDWRISPEENQKRLKRSYSQAAPVR